MTVQTVQTFHYPTTPPRPLAASNKWRKNSVAIASVIKPLTADFHADVSELSPKLQWFQSACSYML